MRALLRCLCGSRRWREARERRQRNDLQARRVEALERILHGELLTSSAAKSVKIAALEKEVVDEAAEEEACRLKLAEHEKALDRLQTRCWASQRQVDYLKEAYVLQGACRGICKIIPRITGMLAVFGRLKDQQADSFATWTEMMSDRELLREDDAGRKEIEREARRENELVTHKLQQQLLELEKAIETKKVGSIGTSNYSFMDG
jgi:hypothetical protein